MIWLQSKLLHPIVQVLVTDVPAQRTVFWKSNHGNSNLQNDKSRGYWMAMDAASCKTIVTEPVVIFNGEGVSKTAGPAAKSYKHARTAAGAHLIFNAFWLIISYCCYQMYTRDSLHQVCVNREFAHKINLD